MLRLLAAPLLLVVIAKGNFGVTLVGRHLRTINGLLVPHIERVHILRMLKLVLALSRVNDSLCLDICFLARRSSSRGHTLSIRHRADWLSPPRWIIRIRIEVVASPRKGWQNTLLGVICFEGLVHIWKASVSLNTHWLYLIYIFSSHRFFLLLNMRTVTATAR